MKERYPGYVVKQINIIVDVWGGYSPEVGSKMKELFGEKRARECLMKMQKSILSIPCFDRCQLTITLMSNIKDVCCKLVTVSNGVLPPR